MKTLIVVRHAKSSWDDPDLPDFNRPLNDRGIRDAPRMAKRLKERDITINSMISSGALRALTTCKVFAGILSFPESSIQVSKELYHAGDEMILNVLKNLKDQKVDNELVMIFGHNPGLTEFVNNLADEDIDNIPTTGVVCCELNIERWSEIKWGCGKVAFFDWPKKSK
jgi:phosphohistidine phosphatase